MIEEYVDYTRAYCQIGQSDGDGGRVTPYLLPWIATGNAVFRKGVFKEVGLFDVNLLAHEDDDMATRIVMAGHNISYSPAAEVYHKAHNSLVGYCRWNLIKGLAFPVLLAKYANILKMGFLDILLRAPLLRLANTKRSLRGFVTRFAVTGTRRYAVICIAIAGYVIGTIGSVCGWAAIAVGMKRISPVTNHNGRGRLCWNERDGLAILDYTKKPPRYYHIDNIGKKVWELMSGSHMNEAEIVGVIADEYEENKEDVRNDVNELIRDLKEIGIPGGKNC